jgi:hypothetical protein
MIRQSEHRRCPSNRRRGYSLTEAVVSIGVATTLMLGMGSTVYLVSRTTTDANRPVAQMLSSSLAINDLARDLHYATSFSERSVRAVEFNIADRTGDGIAETVRYEWSGVTGDPLTRSVNGGAAQSVSDDVHDFALSYAVQSVEEELASEETATPATEVLAASFAGWSGITATTMAHTLNANYWLSEYFELVWPVGTTQFQLTKLRVKLGQSSTSGQFTVGIYTAAGGTGPLPSTTQLGTTQTISCATLPTTPDWKELTFSDVIMTNLTSGYNFVFKGTVLGGKVAYLRSTSAPQDSTVMKYSNTGGSSWNPTVTAEKQNDVLFEIYGIFTGGVTESEPEIVERYFVRAVNVALQTGGDDNHRLQSAVDILNAPEVAAP